MNVSSPSFVLPVQIAVAKAHEALNPDGSLKDPKQAGIEGLGRTLASFLMKLKVPKVAESNPARAEVFLDV